MRLRCRVAFLLVLSVVPLMAASAASAEECVPSTSQPTFAIDVPFPSGTKTYYHVGDWAYSATSHWIYEESNGIEGLQRGDEIDDDTCGGMIPSDTIIF